MIIQKANLVYSKELIPLNLNEVKHIVIHHAEAFEADPQTIHKWHLANGWNGAGYGYYVRKSGDIFAMRGLNIGAHCAGKNSTTIGICCEGNWEIDSELPERMMISLLDCINYCRGLLPNTVTIEPHMVFYATQCPGRFLFNAMPKIRNIADAFLVIDKLVGKGVIASPDYWKRALWLELNPNSDYFKTLVLNLSKIL